MEEFDALFALKAPCSKMEPRSSAVKIWMFCPNLLSI